MSETEQAEETLRMAQAMPDVAAMIAKDARENLGSTDVVSVGSVFAREIQGVTCYLVAAIDRSNGPLFLTESVWIVPGTVSADD
jgi:hypothetical protein